MQKLVTKILRGSLLAGAALLTLASASQATTISYTSSITFSPAATYAGVSNTFYMPYTAANGNVTAGSSAVNVGSFITDSGTASVASTGIEFSITPTIGATTYSPVNFFAEITNPSTNVYCLDFATSSTGSFSTTSCSGGNSSTLLTETFDSNQFEVELPSYLKINSVTKTTSVPVTFAAVPVVTPEPASMGLVGIVLAGFGGLALRRRRAAERV